MAAGLTALRRWGPAAVLGAGLLLNLSVASQQRLPLRAELSDMIPRTALGWTGKDVILSPAEVRVAGVTSYLMRNYESGTADSSWFSVYVGYYDYQVQGRTIHSPKNCLPGAGWEPLAARTATIATAQGPVIVNRYILARESQQALVLYWYQGRGRVAASEYAVKWDLLRDAALRRRSDEALVRVIVPVTEGEEAAFQRAVATAQAVIPALYRALPS